MKDTFLRIITSKTTIIFLLASGVASAFGIAKMIGAEIGNDAGMQVVGSFFLLAVGVGISINALHLYTYSYDTGNIVALVIAFGMSLTTVIGFLTVTSSVVSESQKSASSLTVLKEDYETKQREYNQLLFHKKLRERERYAPKYEAAKTAYFAALKDEGVVSQASALTFFADVAQFWQVPMNTVTNWLLGFFAIIIEGGMAFSHLTTRTPERTSSRTVTRTPSAPKPNKPRKQSRPAPNVTDISSDISNKRKAELLQMVRDEKASGNRSPFATVAAKHYKGKSDALRMMLNRYVAEQQQTAVA